MNSASGHLACLVACSVRSFPICVESFSSSHMTSRSMASDCWPNGVATWSDHCNFLNVLFANAEREDLTGLLPTWSRDKDPQSQFEAKPCYLTFVRGINKINDLQMIEGSFGIFQDQQNWEKTKVKCIRSSTAFTTLSGDTIRSHTIARQLSMAAIATARSALEVMASGKEHHAQGQPTLIHMANCLKLV